MKIVYKAILIVSVTTLLGGATYAQKSESTFSDRIFLEGTGTALVPSGTPAALGGGLGFGLAFRDFNLLLRPQGLMLDPNGSARFVINPILQVEAKFRLMPNLLTLLPYANVGALMVKLIHIDGSLGPNTTGFYTEVGSGLEVELTHEITLIPRVGFAFSKAVEAPDSISFTGPVFSLSARYAFGRNKALDY